VGFRVPVAAGRSKAYRKLQQIAWQGGMAERGHAGGHLSSGASEFVKHYVAPFVLSKRWDGRTVARVLSRHGGNGSSPLSPGTGKLLPPPPGVRPEDRR
jgi:hypothetical protein